MMNYVLSPFYPHYYCFFLPNAFPSTTVPVESTAVPETPNQENADINPVKCQEPFETERIILTKQDLQRQGYKQVKKAWTEEEDYILLRLCKDENIRFEEVARHMEGRNAKMCYSRYRRLVNQSKECWTKAQDDKLRALVQEFGLNNWKSLTQLFPNRNFKQLKDHYENYLRPNLCTEEWTLEEDLQLIDLYNRYGKEWRVIQKEMYWRSRNQLKNRLCGRIQRLDAKKKEETGKINVLVKEQVLTY